MLDFTKQKAPLANEGTEFSGVMFFATLIICIIISVYLSIVGP
jgi:hypothetical protein